MPKAVWNGTVVAESNNCVVVEGNQYFPPDAVKSEYFQASEKRTVCPWKGQARYYDLVVDGKTNSNAAWVYPETKDAAKNIEGYYAFWGAVQVEV